jgi:hypothetical protein
MCVPNLAPIFKNPHMWCRVDLMQCTPIHMTSTLRGEQYSPPIATQYVIKPPKYQKSSKFDLYIYFCNKKYPPIRNHSDPSCCCSINNFSSMYGECGISRRAFGATSHAMSIAKEIVSDICLHSNKHDRPYYR